MQHWLSINRFNLICKVDIDFIGLENPYSKKIDIQSVLGVSYYDPAYHW